MAFENVPTPAELVVNDYDLRTGQCRDCTAEQRSGPGYDWYVGMMAILKDTPPIDGVPQVKYVNLFKAAGAPDDPVLEECYNQANALALANPAWGKRAGQDGLLKVARVCMAERDGRIPDGYMQEFVTALGAKSGFDKRWLWAGGAVVAYLLFVRK